MDVLLLLLLFSSVFPDSSSFNVDSSTWKQLSSPAAGFGYKVVQRRPGSSSRSSSNLPTPSLLVSAPLVQTSRSTRGRIYSCTSSTCTPLALTVPKFAVNMSLGLTLTSDEASGRILACGPTIPRECKSITTFNGVCLELNSMKQVTRTIPSALQECRDAADIAFLMDGSGSVNPQEFRTVKAFVKGLIRRLSGGGTQFSITQYSAYPRIEFYFNTLFSSGSWESKVDGILQLKGGTLTAKAIIHVIRNVFSASGGSRADVKKVLIIITDGESSDKSLLKYAATLAEAQGVVRFAIGVGNAFQDPLAFAELNSIASAPSEKHIFRVENFEALEIIRGALEQSIFPIEGSQTSGGSLQMELAQEGFSGAYVPRGGVQMSSVGASEWRGGFQQYSPSGEKIPSLQPKDMDRNSYMGYSMAVAMTPEGPLTIVGAPRYKHRGAAMVFYRSYQKVDPFPWQFQIGAYFGAEICTMALTPGAEDFTDLVLISAPLHMERDREGRVYVCSVIATRVECQFDAAVLLRGDAVPSGRFGSSLAALPDLNQDGVNDLAVGAPLENDGQGSVYIFHGDGRASINPTYSQRIPGSDIQPGLRFFGQSISQSSFDLSGDGLPDIAVGSKGVVLLLRSQPIVMVETQVRFNPALIPTNNSDCNVPLRNSARVCFTMSRHSPVQSARANIEYKLTLDATRQTPNNRAYFLSKQQEESRSFALELQNRCVDHEFFVEACPKDALNVLSNELTFTFEGFPSSENLRPILAKQAQTTTYHPLGFEIDCGTDNRCVDNLKVDFNFSGSSAVRVGIDDLLNITVLLENRGENSYNSRVILAYPPGLSYRKFTTLQGQVECSSLDSENGLKLGRSECYIDKPIFKSNTKAVFIISYGPDTTNQLNSKILITATTTSGNMQHSPQSELVRTNEIDIKYNVFLSIASSLSYTNFSSGRSDVVKAVQHTLTVLNFVRAFNVTVLIKLPVRLGDTEMWAESSSFQIPGCRRDREEEPSITDFVKEIKKNLTVDCSVARCAVFACSSLIGREQKQVFSVAANLTSSWIPQLGLQAARLRLVSSATVEYDRGRYVFYSVDGNHNPPTHRMEAEVELYAETDLTKEIVGGSVGGLVLLGLLTAALYKAGFFNSRYKQMMQEQETSPDEAADPEDAPLDQ